MVAAMTKFSELHDAWSKRWTQLRADSFRALVFLLLTQDCAGRVQVVGPSQPVMAMFGDDVVLTCRLEPAVDASDMSVEWSREDLDPPYVFVWWDGEELESSKHPAYKGRTSLLVSKLELGDVSLKLSKVKLSDEGKYRCFIPTLGQESTVELVVGTDPSAVISLAGLGRTSSSVELQCESAGWYPQPEVLWLDSEGNLLSAGPTETVRGPDDLYTVSSRVTVEKRHSNKFTCRVQQNNIHQTREALIQVTDDFFKVQSSYTSTIVGLAVGLALSIILLILAVVLFVRTGRPKMIRKMWSLENEKKRENKRINNQLNQEKQERKKAEDEVKTLKSRLTELLDKQKKWMETKRNYLDENLKWIETERKLKTRIQNKIQELDGMNFETNSDPTGSDVMNHQEELEKLQDEKKKWMETVRILKTELQDMNQELVLTGPITLEEVHHHGDYIRLKNTSTEEIQLEGWRLELQINNRKTFTCIFKKSLKLRSGGILSLRRPNWFSKQSYDVDLEWLDLKNWRSEDKQQITFISNNGEIYRLL